MVYCAKCGAQNPEDARFCVQCGAPLYAPRAVGEKEEKHEKYEKSEEALGIRLSPKLFWLIIGLLIFFWGLNQLLESLFRFSLPFMSIALIVMGLYIIYRVLTRQRKT